MTDVWTQTVCGHRPLYVPLMLVAPRLIHAGLGQMALGEESRCHSMLVESVIVREWPELILCGQ